VDIKKSGQKCRTNSSLTKKGKQNVLEAMTQLLVTENG
jgi:hypothetical protein